MLIYTEKRLYVDGYSGNKGKKDVPDCIYFTRKYVNVLNTNSTDL